MAAGVGIVTQEFSLVDTMTGTENVVLSSVGSARVDLRAARAHVADAMQRVGITLEQDRRVGDLSVGERQRVEIVKALYHDCRVLILDEPTAVLPPSDVEALFATLTRLRAHGLGVLFVSHKLSEIAKIADRVVVLRRGRVVGEYDAAATPIDHLATVMVSDGDPGPARQPGRLRPTALVAHDRPVEHRRPATRAGAAPALELAQVSLHDGPRVLLDDLRLQVPAGQVIGVAGVSGNGQTELMAVITGARPVSSGRIKVAGTDVTEFDVAHRLAAGLGRLTEDRRAAVVPSLTVAETLVLEELARYRRRGGLLDRAAIRAHCERLIAEFDIKAAPTDPVSALSGGNLQKVLLARTLSRDPHVIVVAQPTRGLDVAAYRYVHQRLVDQRERGAGILVISEDLDELRALSDEIVVMLGGRLVGALPVAAATDEALGRLMSGALVAA